MITTTKSWLAFNKTLLGMLCRITTMLLMSLGRRICGKRIITTMLRSQMQNSARKLCGCLTSAVRRKSLPLFDQAWDGGR